MNYSLPQLFVPIIGYIMHYTPEDKPAWGGGGGGGGGKGSLKPKLSF